MRQVRVKAVNLEAVRKYLAGLEALVREARRSDDPRVLVCALRVVAWQGKTVQELTGGGLR
jgi:hypothetical protein